MNTSTNGITVTKTVPCDGWTIGFVGDGDQPRVRDLDLAERLGFARPRDIRKLIERLRGAGTLPGVLEVRATVAQTGGRPGTEFWLTEADALIVTAKSETVAANEILRAVVAVFISWRRGELDALQSRRPQLDDSTISSARIGDDPTAMATLRQAIRRVYDARGYSKARIIGYVRKIRGASTPWAVSLHLLDKTVESLEALENGEVSLLSPREERLLVAAKRAERNGQLTLFKGGKAA